MRPTRHSAPLAWPLRPMTYGDAQLLSHSVDAECLCCGLLDGACDCRIDERGWCSVCRRDCEVVRCKR